jgi:biopolymer transport protein ExbD
MTRQNDPKRIRRSRNNVLGLLLVAFVILIFFVSIAKMS